MNIHDPFQIPNEAFDDLRQERDDAARDAYEDTYGGPLYDSLSDATEAALAEATDQDAFRWVTTFVSPANEDEPERYWFVVRETLRNLDDISRPRQEIIGCFWPSNPKTGFAVSPTVKRMAQFIRQASEAPQRTNVPVGGGFYFRWEPELRSEKRGFYSNRKRWQRVYRLLDGNISGNTTAVNCATVEMAQTARAAAKKFARRLDGRI